MVGIIAVAVGLSMVYSFILRGHGHDFSRRQSQTRVSRATGPNFASILAIVGIADVMWSVSSKLPFPGMAPILVVAGVALIAGLVIWNSGTQVALGFIGVALMFWAEGIPHGLITLVVVSLMLWLFGALRGFFG